MSDAYLTAISARRSNYAITPKSSVPDEKLQAIVQACVLHSPTSYNQQSSRAVIVTGEANTKLWKLCSESMLKNIEDGVFGFPFWGFKDRKLKAFGGGHGSVLFFEDQAVTDAMAAKMPMFAQHFPSWTTAASGMLQSAVWTALTLEGLGASLQHNGSFSDELVAEIHQTFGLPTTWKSMAIMPFGDPAAPPAEKSFGPIEERVKFIKA
ncbi:Nitroreductase-like protein [Mycena filopes]|nr:Nitroreductase-like protein [Mycena filopes]